MAQQGNPKDSKTDRYKELVKFSNERNPDFIFREYITGKISRRTAIRSLENTAAYGVLLAGGLAIEEGYSCTDGTEAVDWFNHAQELFTKAEAIRLHMNDGKVDAVIARAQTHNIHLPIHALLSIDSELPPASLADKVYRRTLDTAANLSSERLIADKSTQSRKDMTGILGELAVLLLLERVALREIGTDSWYPLLAHTSEDYRNTHGTTMNRGWDISVFSDALGAPSVDYKIQVKSSPYSGNSRPRTLNPDIPLLYVDPGLRLNAFEREIGTMVIEELSFELDDSLPVKPSMFSWGSTTERLDARTKQLLEIIDS